MTTISTLLNTILPLIIIVSIGFVLGKYKKVDTAPFIDFIIYIASPLLIITSIASSNIKLSSFFKISFAALMIAILQCLLLFFILRVRSKKYKLLLPGTAGNTGFIGYPVALFAFGNTGLSSAIAFDIIGGLFLYTLGVYIVHHKNDIKEIFKLPLIYALLIGLLLNFLDVTIPPPLFIPMDMVGKIAIPLALLVLGYQLTKIKLGNVKISALISSYKVIAGFLIALLIVSLLGLTGLSKNIILLQAAMPPAVMSMVLTHKYGRDSSIAASAVLIGTLASLITIPIILLILPLLS